MRPRTARMVVGTVHSMKPGLVSERSLSEEAAEKNFLAVSSLEME